MPTSIVSFFWQSVGAATSKQLNHHELSFSLSAGSFFAFSPPRWHHGTVLKVIDCDYIYMLVASRFIERYLCKPNETLLVISAFGTPVNIPVKIIFMFFALDLRSHDQSRLYPIK